MRWFNVFAGSGILFLMFFLLLAGCDDEDNGSMQAITRDFTVTITNVAMEKTFSGSGVFNTPVGASQPGPLTPGNVYEFEFSATPGSKLSFATMFVPSNDFFYGPDEDGIELFDGSGNQITGDITGMIQLWDGGTEVNQEPGLGMDQPMRQSGPNTGAIDPDNTVRLAPDDFNNLPPANQVVQVTLTATPPTEFTLRIENVSTSNTLQTSDGGSQAVPLAPGVFVVHTDPGPLFMSGQPDYGDGLEALAEDGDPSGLAGVLDPETGITHILAPGVWAIHSADQPIFTADTPDRGEGLEAVAEDGNPADLAANIATNTAVSSSGIFNMPIGASQAGPLLPGSSYSFSFSASPGAYLSFSTMFVQSNDLFYSPADEGIPLFEVDGQPVIGNTTTSVMLWDAGTEVNERPGFGLNQAPRQSGPDTGTDENGNVRLVNDGFSYPATSDVIEVTISVQ